MGRGCSVLAWTRPGLLLQEAPAAEVASQPGGGSSARCPGLHLPPGCRPRVGRGKVLAGSCDKPLQEQAGVVAFKCVY